MTITSLTTNSLTVTSPTVESVFAMDDKALNFFSTKGANGSHFNYGTAGNWYIRPADNTGSVYVRNYVAESDRNKKHNIKPCEDDVMRKVNLLNPVQYEWEGTTVKKNKDL